MNRPNSDFDITFQHIELIAPRVNSGVQIMLVIEGELKVETSERFYHLAEKEILVLNRNQAYQIEGSTNNKVMTLAINDRFMENNYPEYHNYRFECYSREVDLGREGMIDSIRKLLSDIIISYYRQDESFYIELKSYVCQLLLILIRGFKKAGSAVQKIDTTDQRLLEIIDYMDRNYSQMITLEEVAQKFYLSTSYLSRYFKQKMGVGFSQYLMNIRLRHSIKDLLYTDDSISQIAMNNGFPNTKSFSTFFKKTYNMTPNEYRKLNEMKKEDSIENYSKEDSIDLIKSSEIIAKLTDIEFEEQKTYHHTEVNYKNLSIELTLNTNNTMRSPDYLLIVGKITTLLKEDIRSQILEAKEDLKIKYIGVSHPISTTAIPPEVETDEPIPSSSPYFNIDSALEFMKQHNLALFIRVRYVEITKNEEQYFKKLTQFMRHCLQMHGESFVKKWRVMFYEPYFTGIEAKRLQEVYLRLYKTLKDILPSIKIGVYMPFSFREERTSKAHEWQLAHDEYIDFIGYNANQNEVIDFDEMDEEKFDLAKDYIKQKTNKLKQYLKKHHMEKPMHLVSWNTLSGKTRYTNGTFFRGALILKSILDIADEVDTIGLWINTSAHENADERRRYRMDGIELFHYLRGKRPAYFSLAYLERLKGEVVSYGKNHIMTRNDRGYQLVLMNWNLINPYLSIEENFLQRLNVELSVKISGLPAGEYQVRKHVFDKNNGALYTKWWNLNSKHGMDKEVIDYIINSSLPSLEIFDETIDGEWSFYTYLTSNAVHFFDIRKAYKL